MDYHEFYTLWRKCTHYFDDESLWWTRLHKLDIYKEKDLVSYWERMQSLSDNKKFIHFLLSKQIPNEVDDNLSSIELYIVDYLCDYTITSKNKQWSHINISTTALSHLRSAIISQIDKIIQEVIRFEYDVYTSAYSNCSYSYFLNHITRESEWIEYMAESYPVLFSDLNNFVVNYKNLVDEFWQRLKIDYLDICHKFSIPQSVFKIIDLNLFCGDMHRNGCNTIRISFTDDKKEVYTFYYKPKPLASDCVWNAILKQLYNIGLKQTSLLTTNIDKISYGWQKDANCTKEIDGNHIKSLCFNQGVNVGLAYIFGIQDLIADNVLLKNDMPIFFDMEMLFTPTLKMENDYYIASNVSQHYLQGVIKTGLIPCFGFETLNHIGYDNSGLSVGIGRKQQVSYDSFFTEDLLRGFDYICGFVKKHKKEIVGILREEVDKCDHLQMRYLIRFTFNYSQLFKFLYSPDCQSDVCKRHLAIENLWLGFDKKILNEDIIQDEIRQISHGDIPLFSCRPYSRHLYNEKGEIVVHDYFQTDGINACIERITNLSDVDILFQKDVISRSLFIHGYTKETDVLLPLLKDFEKSTISPIEQIANVLYGLPMGFDDNKYFTYIDYVISKDDMWSQGVQNLDMFQGVAGVGVFFMAWYRYSQDVRAKEIAIKIFNESLEYLQLNRISLFDSPIAKFGVMTYPCSIIYYYILGRKILGADCLQLRDNDLLLILDYIESKYHKDTHLDYFSGITGLVLLLIELNTMLPNERISKTVHLLGEYLYSSAEPIGDNMISWNKPSFGMWGGWAHGNSSIAYALFKLWHFSSEKRYYSAGVKALAYDQSLLDKSRAFWNKTAFTKGDIHHSWGNGSAGIAMSRCLIAHYYKNEFMDIEIETAKNIIKNEIFKHNYTDHSIGSGLLGLIEICGMLDDTFPVKQVIESQFSQIRLTDYKYGGWNGNPIVTGLYYGLAGIGYNLIKLQHDNTLPSLLWI